MKQLSPYAIYRKMTSSVVDRKHGRIIDAKQEIKKMICLLVVGVNKDDSGGIGRRGFFS